jgi:hypothetical protein
LVDGQNHEILKPATIENTEEEIKKGQSRETGNIGYTRRKQTKQIHNTKCVGHPYTNKHK